MTLGKWPLDATSTAQTAHAKPLNEGHDDGEHGHDQGNVKSYPERPGIVRYLETVVYKRVDHPGVDGNDADRCEYLSGEHNYKELQ